MTDWRVLLLSGAAFLILLAGLLALALPDSYEGRVVYTIDATHAIRALDAVGLTLIALGGAMAWGAGMLWRRRVTRQ